MTREPNAFQRTLQRVARGLFGINFGVPGADTYEFSRAWNTGTDASSKTLDEPYRKSAALATAISRLCEDAASVDWEVYTVGADAPLKDHPLLGLWQRPNPQLTGRQLWVCTYISRKLFGESFWYYPDLVVGQSGGLRATMANDGEIVVLDPRRVKHRIGRDGELVWTYVVSGNEVPLEVDRLTHFKRPNPYEPVRGLAELDAVSDEVESDHYAIRWNRAFFADQNGIPASVLVPPQDDATPPQDKLDFVERIRSQHRSGRRSVSMVPPGWDWKELGINQREMEFRALREYSREQILAIYGVPPFLAGVLDKANYANAREQKEVYWLGTVTRFLAEIAGVLNHDFLPKVGIQGVEVRPDWESVKALTENLAEKVAVAKDLFTIGFTKRQIVERLDLGIDVDELPDADVGYIPFSVMPAAIAVAPPEPQPEPLRDEPVEDEEQERGLVRRSRRDMREQRRALVWRNIINLTRDLEQRFNSVIRRHMKEIEDEVLENVNGTKGWLAVHGKADESERVTLLFDIELAQRRLMRAAEGVQKQSMKRGAESVFDLAGLAISFDIDDPVAAAKMNELQYKITRIDETIERLLRDSLSEGLEAGESPQQLAARVRSAMDVSRGRSMTIARTETGFAFNTGRNEGMRQAGIERQEWLTSRDGKVRDTHAPLDGQVIAIGETFSNGLRYPQDPSGPPGEVINCRCVALPVVTERGSS